MEQEVIQKTDPRYIDELDEDPGIRGQEFFCYSYVAPDARQKSGIAGFKFRGAFHTYEDAKKRANELRMFDSNFDIFVGESFKWCPSFPNPDQIEEEEFLEEKLNALIKGQKEHRLLTAQHFNERKRKLMEEAMREGTREAQVAKSGEKEHLVAVRTRLENTEAEVALLKEKLSKALRLQQEDKKKLLNYTEEEIQEADRIEENIKGKKPIIATEVDPGTFESENIKTHSEQSYTV